MADLPGGIRAAFFNGKRVERIYRGNQLVYEALVEQTLPATANVRTLTNAGQTFYLAQWNPFRPIDAAFRGSAGRWATSISANPTRSRILFTVFNTATSTGGAPSDLSTNWERNGYIKFAVAGQTVIMANAPDATANPVRDSSGSYLWQPPNYSDIERLFQAALGRPMTVTLGAPGISIASPDPGSTPAPSGPRHTATVTAGGSGSNVGYNGPAATGSISAGSYSTPNGTSVNIIHARIVGSVMNFALSGTVPVGQFPARIVSSAGGNTVTWTRPSSVRAVSGGTRADYTTTDTISSVWTSGASITLQLFDS